MRYLGTFMVLTCIVVTSFSRPPKSNESVESVQEEVEYEGEDESTNEDSLRDEDESSQNKQETTYDQEEEAIQKPINTEGKRDVAPSNERPPKDKSDSSPDYKLSGDRELEDMNPSDAYQPNRQQRPNRYTEDNEVNEQAEMAQQLVNFNTPNGNQFPRQVAFNRQSLKTTADDRADELFENAVAKERTFKISNRPSHIDSAVEPDHEGFFKHYYKTLLQTADDKAKLEDKNYENFPLNVYRNRRQAQDMDSLDNNLKSKDRNTVHENEEMAIKRHINKLSEQELEELLNSLPDEKRALLNKIIENEKGHYDNLSKRDITKKAGAVEENNDIDNGVFESSKLQGGASVDVKNDAAPNIDTTENTKPSDYHTEISEASSQKKTSNQELSCDKDANVNLVESKSAVTSSDVLSNNGESKNQVNLESNDLSSKINNKRETDINDSENEDSSFHDANFINTDLNPSDLNDNANEENIGYSCQDEDSSQLVSNDDQSEDNVLDHANKREAFLENADSFKSLEESFPNSNTYKESGQYSELDMVPLVRVKRKNGGVSIKKRSAELVSDSKVAYIPYRAENDDDDSEEGNEFEDDGFYERSSNYAKDIEKPSNDVAVEKNLSKREKTEHTDISRGENIESDTMNIGSDTDSVLSGVEGVDDNLMFNSGTRNIRTVEKKSRDVENNESESSLIDAESKSQTDNLNVLNYQENDAFGSLPRNYEGDLNRLKRIRRVQPPCDNVSSNTDKQTNSL